MLDNTDITNKTIDHIYFLYTTDTELENIKFKILDHSLCQQFSYTFFKGVDGKSELHRQFQDYLDESLDSTVTRCKRNLELYTKYNMKNTLKKVRAWELNNENSRIQTVGALGHIYSIINILKDALIKKYNKILLIESDFYLHKDFMSKLDQYSLQIRKSKVFYLGASQHTWDNISISQSPRSSQNPISWYKADNTTGDFWCDSR